MSVDPLRHLEVFQPHAFGSKRVDVVGCGAVGSRVALSLAKLGIERIHLWDFDSVEEHNVANQVFGHGDVGLSKVAALATRIETDTGVQVTQHVEEVTGETKLGEIVFLLVDTMASRKAIWDGALKLHPRVRLLVETRMGADSGRVYALNPSKRDHIARWEETLYADEDAETSACGASVSVGPTAEILAGYAVWQMIRWFSVEQGEDDALEQEIIFALRSETAAMTRRF